MEKTHRIDTLLLLDTFGEESQKLYDSFKLSGADMTVLVIEDSGFLPVDVISVDQYFCGSYKNEKYNRPRFFNQIEVPDYWEISGTRTGGKIKNLSKEKARIFYAFPNEKRLVRIVEWLDVKGNVRISEHYNKHGILYAKTVFNKEGKRFSKTIFDVNGKEVLFENFVTGDVILNRGKEVVVFKNKMEYIHYVIIEMKAEKARICYNSLSTSFSVSRRLADNGGKDILFWQESERPDIPGNMQLILNGREKRTKRICVQKKDSYDRLIELGAPKECLKKIGYVYDFVRDNRGSSDILICTNSDQIRDIEVLIKELPEFTFHIAAVTEMSPKLLGLGASENVRLYPGVKKKQLDRLFDICDIYLDINYQNEICDALNRAFLNNQLILGFSDTLHKKSLISEKHVFLKCEELIDMLKVISKDNTVIEDYLIAQKADAMAETPKEYMLLQEKED